MNKDEIQAVRRTNLERLLANEASQKTFAEKVGIDKGSVSRMLTEKATITNSMAKRFEIASNKAEGWLSTDHSSSLDAVIKVDLAVEGVMAVLDYLKEVEIEATRIDPAAMRSIINLTLTDTIASESVDTVQIKDSLLTSFLNSVAH